MTTKPAIKVLAVIVALIVIVAVVYVALANNKGSGNENEPTSHYVTIYDMANRNVTAVKEMNPRYIIGSGVGALRFISYMNCSSLVVAVEARESSAYCAKSYMYAFGYDNTSKFNRSIGSGGDGLIEYPEQLMMLAHPPQVIFYSVTSPTLTVQQQTYINNAERLGMKVVVVLELDTMLNSASNGLSGTFVKQTMLMGKVLNKTERASELMAFMNNTISDLVTRMSGVSAHDKAVSAYIGSLSYSGAKGFDFSSSWYDPFAILGVNNTVTGGSSVVYQINMESIIAKNPDYIFLDPTGYKTFLTNWNNGSSAMSKNALMALSAFHDGRVYMTIPFIWYGVNFDNVLLGAYYIGSILYPSAFSDVNMTKKASDIYTAFVGMDCYHGMDTWFVKNRSTHITGLAGVIAT